MLSRLSGLIFARVADADQPHSRVVFRRGRYQHFDLRWRSVSSPAMAANRRAARPPADQKLEVG